MFKCKIDLAAYDKSNKTVPNPEFAKTKAISKASVKKLASKAGEKAAFYISKDYFEEKGKVVGHFFAVGTSKKLAKEFVTKEMKGKGQSKDPKDAATGEVCVKNIGGKDKLCFEPHPKCKIPAGLWPKLLKSLKPFFAGFKAVVVVDGKTLEEEPGGEEDTSDDGEEIVFEEAGAEEQGGFEDEGEEASEEAPTPQNLAALQAEIKGIIDAVKAFASTEMAAVKADPSAKTVMAAWKKGQDIATKVEGWIKSAAGNTALAKESAAATSAKDSVAKIIAQLQPQIDKINAKQGEKSTAEMDGLHTNISGMIADLMKNFGAEIENIPGIKDALASFK